MSTTTRHTPTIPNADRHGYHARRWPLRVMALVFVAVLGGLIAWVALRNQQPGFTTLPTPTISAPAAPQAGPGTARSKGAVAGANAPSAQSVSIAPARATQIYVPSANPDLVISTPVNPMNDCRKVIDPPRDPKRFGGVFDCSDFAQPGTDSSSLTVLAGHSDKFVPTAFNRLYEQEQSLTGREVFLKTAASGDKWLVYKIEHVYVTPQTDLPYLTEVWGVPGKSTAGRLVLVTCRQRPDVTPAVENYVAVGQFVGVR